VQAATNNILEYQAKQQYKQMKTHYKQTISAQMIDILK
jgi:hypothetical protein